jgi:hypothetical protein
VPQEDEPAEDQQDEDDENQGHARDRASGLHGGSSCGARGRAVRYPRRTRVM